MVTYQRALPAVDQDRNVDPAYRRPDHSLDLVMAQPEHRPPLTHDLDRIGVGLTGGTRFWKELGRARGTFPFPKGTVRRRLNACWAAFTSSRCSQAVEMKREGSVVHLCR